MKKLAFTIFMILSFSAMEAQNLNDYKYVIVPESFDFSKEKNQHQLNSLLKFLLEKEGFETLMKNETRPEDLQQDNCKALIADVIEDSGLFTTKMRITFEDCRGNLIFSSEEGTSREKEYKIAWHEALRQAFVSVEAMNYKYNADATPTIPITPETPQIEEEAEVAAEIPEEEKTIPESTAEPEAIASKENVSEEKKTGNLNFEKDGTNFQLQENENGYALYQKDMSEPFALLIRSQERESYIYNSVTKQGIATFTKDGDLVVEHFDASKGISVKTTYKLQKD
ncbi:MAG TPA: hypothetical protein VLO29_08050 [Salegentibacter sp.]|nr:hypothetical protein [Salegentibacter sp.]